MKKIILPIVLFVLLSAGCNKTQNRPDTSSNSSTTNQIKVVNSPYSTSTSNTNTFPDDYVYKGDINPKAYLDTSDWKTYIGSNIAFAYPKNLTAATSTYVNFKNEPVFQISIFDPIKEAQVANCEGDCIDSSLIMVSYQKDVYNHSPNNYFVSLTDLLNKNTTTIDGQKTYVYKGITPPVFQNYRVVFENDKMFLFSSSSINMDAYNHYYPEDHDGQVFETLLTTVHFLKP